MATVSTFTEVAMIDTRNNAGTITLPLTTTVPFRTLTFKDIYGNFSRRSFTLNTQGSDLFEDGIASKTFSNDFAFIQVYAGGNNRWYILDATTTTSQIMSSLVVSSITGDGSGLRALPAISTASLQSTIQGLGTYGYVSTASIQSTLQGLGTFGYISTSQLFSTVAGIGAGLGSGFTGSTNALSAGTVTTSILSTLRVNASSIQASNGNFSSIVTNSIQIGTGLGWLQLPPLQVTAISSIVSYTNQAYMNSTMLGGNSSQTAIQFFGLTGQYTNTVIEEQSTGTGTQELLLFKGSSVSDRIRLATTGNLVFEPGIAAQSFVNNIALPTPAMIINTSSNVGILTANPVTPLDVAGTARAQTVSTLALNTSSINGMAFGQPASTVFTFSQNTSNFFFNTLQNFSTPISTAALFTSNTSNFAAGALQNWSAPLSSVALFTSNTSNFATNILQNLSAPLSTVAQFTSNTSNFAAGISQNWSAPLSSVALFTSNTSNFAANFLQNFSTPVSTVALFTSNTSNWAANAFQDFSTQTQSTVRGLGSAGYISTSQLFSTVLGLSLTGFNGSTNQLSAGQLLVSSILGQHTTSTMIVSGSELIRFNGTTAPTLYGLSTDTLTLQSSSNSYAGGVASLAFANTTANYPLARIYGIDSASTGPAISQLVFQTVPTSTTSFNTNFTYTGSDQTFTVPTGVTSVQVKLWGAGGGGGRFGGGAGGAGAYVRGILTVVPGQTYTIIVGNGGVANAANSYAYGGGGASTDAQYFSGSGGGRSAIQLNVNTTITSSSATGSTVTYTCSSNHGLVAGQPVVISGLSPAGYNGNYAVSSVAGSTQFTVVSGQTGAMTGTGTIRAELVNAGAGGGGSRTSGSVTGGAATFSGTAFAGLNSGSNAGGGGGTQTGGGSPGGGSVLQGGTAGSSGGGGGGGYYGGGAGATGPGSDAGGGGGSSYTSHPNFSLQAGANSPNSQNQAPQTSDSSYQAGVAAGGGSSTNGGTGLAVLASVGNALSEVMRINTSGFLGIGTAAPQTLLDVAGTARAPTLSTQALFISSINGTVLGAPASTVALFTSNTSNWAANFGQNWSTPLSTVAAFTSNTSNWAANFGQNFSTPVSSVALFTSNTSNFAQNILQNFSTPVSTVALFTSNTSNFAQNILQNWSAPLSSVALFTSNTSNFAANILQNFSTPLSTVAAFTSNTSNWTNNILITHNISAAASTVALFTSNTSNFAANILQNFSTPVSSVALFTSNTSNFAANILQNFSTPVSTVALFTSNTSNFAANILQNFSTPVSTVALFTSNTSNWAANAFQDFSTQTQSTVRGLGTTGYISSTQLFSTVTGLGSAFTTNQLSAGQIVASTLSSYNIFATVGAISSLTVNSLQFGPGDGFIDMGDLVTTSISTITERVGTLVSMSTLLGVQSSQTALAFFGLHGTWQNTVISEQTTGTGTQELLIQKTSSVSDQIRLQTTGNILFEAGVSARSFPTTTPATNATFYIQGTTSNIGIGTNNPQATLDVVGSVRAPILSTQSLFMSSINGITLGVPASTVALFTSNTSNFAAGVLQNWSTPTSTVALFTSNTSNFASGILQNWSTPISTVALFTSNTSNWTNNILITHNISSAVSSVAIFTSNTSNWASNILQNWSTALSTVAQFTSNTSNAAGGGFTGSTTQLSAAVILVSSLSSAYTYAQQSYVSSLQVDSLQIGTGTGWVDIGPIQSVEVSSLQTNTGILYTSNAYFGTVSSQTALQMFGLNGSYQNSILAERSTGTTSQELILFKGSSISDQIRLQTTGNFLIETGVAARTFPNMGQVTTPTLYANTSGQVGIGTNNPSGYTLNVAGTGFFQTSISTPTLYAGTIYYSVAFV